MNNKLCTYTGIYNIFINPKDNFMFCIICKNACSYIKYITLYNKFNYHKEQDTQIYHNTCDHKNLFCYPQGQHWVLPSGHITSFDINNYKLVYIYRDPFERFVSLYNDKILHKLWFSYQDTGLTEKTSFEEFIDFAKYQITYTENPINIEEHIRPQYLYYTTRVDYFVHINKLNKFITEFNISDDLSFINSHNHSMDEYEKYKDVIYDMYEKDLDLLNLYKDVEYN